MRIITGLSSHDDADACRRDESRSATIRRASYAQDDDDDDDDDNDDDDDDGDGALRFATTGGSSQSSARARAEDWLMAFHVWLPRRPPERGWTLIQKDRRGFMPFSAFCEYLLLLNYYGWDALNCESTCRGWSPSKIGRPDGVAVTILR
jgi:hypothetical protein